MRSQNFYEETPKSSKQTTDGHETTTLFLFSLPQYIFIGIAFHTATQFRKPIYTNLPFLFLLSLQLAMAMWLILGPLPFMKSALEMADLDFYFRIIIAGGTLINGMLTLLYERLVVYIWGRKEMQEKVCFEGVIHEKLD